MTINSYAIRIFLFVLFSVFIPVCLSGPTWAVVRENGREAPVIPEAIEADGASIDSLIDPADQADPDSSDAQLGEQEHPEDKSKSEGNDKKEEEKNAQRQATASEETDTSSSSGVGTIPIPKPDKFTGSAALTVPIAVPPGRLGLAPNLTIRYSSTQRNGWLGVGWDLDMGAIQRSTKRGVNYSAKDFVVVVNGTSSELVSRTEWGANYYGTKIEGAFSKFYFDGRTTVTSNGFVQTTTDGTKYYFGSTILSRQTDPADSTRVFKWCLDKVQDPNGNYMTISYIKDQGEIYLDNISYTYTSNNTLACYQIKFYRETRTDVVVSYLPKFQVITASRLKTVDISLTRNGSRVRAYGLSYTPSTSPSARSQLTGFQEYGSNAMVNGSGAVTLPPGATTVPATSFGWQQGGLGTFYSAPLGGIEPEKISSLTDPIDGFYKYQTGDFNGDGLTDVLREEILDENSDPDQPWYTLYITIYTSNGDGTFQEFSHNAFVLTYIVVPLYYTRDYLVKLGDFNGDGLTDYLLYVGDKGEGTHPIVYFSNGYGMNSPLSSDAGIPFAHYHDEWHPGDFNGDGMTDILVQNLTTGAVYLSNGDGTFTYKVTVFSDTADHDCRLSLGDFNGDGLTDVIWRPSEHTAWRVYLTNVTADGKITFTTVSNLFSSSWDGPVVGDFNGDGLTDVILWQNNNGWYIFLGKGDGAFENGKKVCDYNYVISGVGDFNGDGLTDAIIHYYDNSNATIYFSKGDGTFLPKTNVAASISDIVGDYNGDGLDDGIKIGSGFTSGTVYFATGPVPDLLSTVDNGRGGSTDLAYQPSSQYKNKRLPFILQTLANITVDDGLGNTSTTNYTYGGGYFDYPTREYRGFEYTQQTNPDGTTEATCFHQGGEPGAATPWCLNAGITIVAADNYYFEGRPYLTELREPAPLARLLSRQINTWESLTMSPITVPPDNRSKFVKLRKKNTQSYDNGITPFLEVEENYSYHDQVDYKTIDSTITNATSTGNLYKTVTKEVTAPTAETITSEKRFFLPNSSSNPWLWRVYQETLTGYTSGERRKTIYEYYPATGNLKSVENILDEKPAGTTTNPKVTYTYDTPTASYGNPTVVTDARGYWATTTYDAKSMTYPEKVYDCTGRLVKEQAYDYRYGKVLWVKDANSKQTN